MSHQKTLQDLGLSEYEARIYLALLPMQRATASGLGHRIGINRNLARDAANNLAEIGLVTALAEGNAYYFSAESPEKLAHLVGQKRNEVQTLDKALISALPDLKKTHNPESIKPVIEYFEQDTGVKEIYERFLSRGAEVFCFTDVESKKKVLGEAFFQDFRQRRIEKCVWTNAIKPDTTDARVDIKGSEKILRRAKLMPQLSLENGEIRISAHKVAIITFGDDKPRGFLIEDPTVARFFKNIFKSVWQHLPDEDSF